METVNIKHNGCEYNIDSATLEKCKVIPAPLYSRMEVLRGEWVPPISLRCFHISPINGMVSEYGNSLYDLTLEHHEQGRKFFPTRELAEEYLLIGEGKWLPKVGDELFELNCCVKPPVLYGGQTLNHALMSAKYPNRYFFPSAKQRDEYIAKNKPVRPLVGKEVKLTVDGTEYKATLQ